MFLGQFIFSVKNTIPIFSLESTLDKLDKTLLAIRMCGKNLLETGMAGPMESRLI
jgi:ribosomal protein S2